MPIDINQFWSLLEESRLVELSKIQAVRGEFEAATANDSNENLTAEALAQWLVDQKVISPYQSKILLAGKTGPLRFGGYAVLSKIVEGPRRGSFKSVHVKTGYPVNLQFMQGSEPADLQIWKQIEALTERVSTIVHPNLVPIFETVSLPTYGHILRVLDAASS